MDDKREKFDPAAELESAVEARKRILGALNVLRDDDQKMTAEYAGELTRLTARIKVLRQVIASSTVFCPFAIADGENPLTDWIVTAGGDADGAGNGAGSDSWFTGNFGPGEV